MRLFHTTVQVEGQELRVHEERVLKHAKVLRLKAGDEVAVQQQGDAFTTRWSCTIKELTKDVLVCAIVDSETVAHTSAGPGMLVGLPHTIDKLHTIVQKLTEIGIQDIVFWKNEYSQGHDISVKKMSKLCKISLESVEQSNARSLPRISQVDNIHEWVVGKELVLFDFEGEESSILSGVPKDKMYGVVGPEGHFSPRDFETIGFQVLHKIALGSTILRTETAAIIGAWLIKNV